MKSIVEDDGTVTMYTECDGTGAMTGWPYAVAPKDEPHGYVPKDSPAFVKDVGGPYGEQIGGNHYSKYKIQPTEYIIKNGLNFCEGNVVKYITRWKDKGGVEDLKKARHYIDMLIEENK